MNNNKWKMKFYTIWGGQAVSLLTSSVLQMALIWHLTNKTGSAAVLSLASIAGFLPTAILGIYAGAMVDRWNRKWTMVGADLFIAAVSMLIVVYASFAEVPVWFVIVILFIRSIGTAFHTPAISAITPLLVPEEELTKCAGYTQSLQTAGFILGTAIAAVLYPIWNLSGMVLLDVLGAVIASLAVVVVKIPTLDKQSTFIKPDVRAEMKEGYRAIRKEKGLFALLWIGTIFMFFYSPINALFPLMSMDYFGGTTTHASVAEIAFAVGMLLGGVLLGMWGGFKRRGLGMITAILLMGGAIAASGLVPEKGFPIFAMCCIVMGVSVPFYTGPQTALMQERIAPQYLGRVFGLYGSLMSLAMPFGLILSGLFADRIGVNWWFFISGTLIVVVGIATWMIKSVREII